VGQVQSVGGAAIRDINLAVERRSSREERTVKRSAHGSRLGGKRGCRAYAGLGAVVDCDESSGGLREHVSAGLLRKVEDGSRFRRGETGDGENRLGVLDVSAKIPEAVEQLRSATGAAVGVGGKDALKHLAGRNRPACKVKLGNPIENLARSQGQR